MLNLITPMNITITIMIITTMITMNTLITLIILINEATTIDAMHLLLTQLQRLSSEPPDLLPELQNMHQILYIPGEERKNCRR